MIELEGATKVYGTGKAKVQALNIERLVVPKGQFLSVMGASGSGKSTMLNLLGALDVPDSGRISIDGQDISKLDDDGLSRFRRERLGYIFQFFNLLPTLTALENVLLPGLLAGRDHHELEATGLDLLKMVRLKGRGNHRPDEMSGGEMQRVAIARALLLKPALLLADEPTGNLDSKTGLEVLALFREATRLRGLTVVMVTHDPRAARIGDRIVQLADGRIVGDEMVENAS